MPHRLHATDQIDMIDPNIIVWELDYPARIVVGMVSFMSSICINVKYKCYRLRSCCHQLTVKLTLTIN